MCEECSHENEVADVLYLQVPTYMSCGMAKSVGDGQASARAGVSSAFATAGGHGQAEKPITDGIDGGIHHEDGA